MRGPEGPVILPRMMIAMSGWEMLSHLINLAIAYVLALPIGWNRERAERSAGIRTFPLVAMAACGFVLVAIRILGPDSIGQARILEGLITGSASSAVARY